MSGLVRELLLDYSMNRLHIDLRSDLTIAVQDTVESGVFTSLEIQYLNLYLSGYTAVEIAALCTTDTEKIESTLERLFTAIETHSGYTDDSFIHKLELTKRYRANRLRELSSFLRQHSKTYTTHDLVER